MADIVKSPVSEAFHHVGLIVKDADKTAEFYESLGIGPFEPLAMEAVERKLRGKPFGGVKLKIRLAHVGRTRIELIQPVEGTGPWFEFLQRRGEGCAHVGFVVDDVKTAKAEMVNRGLMILYESWFSNGGAAAYLESSEPTGVVFEIFQRPSDYVPRE